MEEVRAEEMGNFLISMAAGIEVILNDTLACLMS